jgi:hypothetical protein
MLNSIVLHHSIYSFQVMFGQVSLLGLPESNLVGRNGRCRLRGRSVGGVDVSV